MVNNQNWSRMANAPISMFQNEPFLDEIALLLLHAFNRRIHSQLVKMKKKNTVSKYLTHTIEIVVCIFTWNYHRSFTVTVIRCCSLFWLFFIYLTISFIEIHSFIWIGLEVLNKFAINPNLGCSKKGVQMKKGSLYPLFSS